MKKLFGILFVLCLLCCGHFPKAYHYINHGGYSNIPLKTIPIWVDGTFGEADKLAIDDAINQWNYALNGYLRLQVVSYTFDMEDSILERNARGEGWLILKVGTSHPMVASLDKVEPGQPQTWTLAWANAIGGTRMSLIRSRIDNKWVTGVVLHEAGHLLGAEHDNVYLMKDTFVWEDSRCVDYAAMKLVAAYQHLPLNRMNYCIYGYAPEVH